MDLIEDRVVVILNEVIESHRHIPGHVIVVRVFVQERVVMRKHVNDLQLHILRVNILVFQNIEGFSVIHCFQS